MHYKVRYQFRGYNGLIKKSVPTMFARALNINCPLVRKQKGQKCRVTQPRYVRDPRPYIYRAYSESNDSLLFRASALPNEDRRKLTTLHLPRPIPTGPSFLVLDSRTGYVRRHFVIVLLARSLKIATFIRSLPSPPLHLKAIIAYDAKDNRFERINFLSRCS